ncbi:MAG: hypothetical protein ACLSDO_07810, partial [Anaerotruncus colihominis]
VIPSACLKPSLDAAEHGLQRYVGRFTYETLSNGDMQTYPTPEEFVVDPLVNHDEQHPLPALAREQRRGFFKETPKEYYMWHGYLCPTETGMHRLSLQSKFPGLD